MDIPAGSGDHRPACSRESADGRRPPILGSLTIPGSPEQVSGARAFVARVLARLPGIDSDSAALMTSELVTNAIQHTRSGDGGTVTVTVTGLPDGVVIEVTDQGSVGSPIVKSEIYAAEGHGLYLVQCLSAQWGYLRRPAGGTTVWFHLPMAGADQPSPTAARIPEQIRATS